MHFNMKHHHLTHKEVFQVKIVPILKITVAPFQDIFSRIFDWANLFLLSVYCLLRKPCTALVNAVVVQTAKQSTRYLFLTMAQTCSQLICVPSCLLNRSRGASKSHTPSHTHTQTQSLSRGNPPKKRERKE